MGGRTVPLLSALLWTIPPHSSTICLLPRFLVSGRKTETYFTWFPISWDRGMVFLYVWCLNACFMNKISRKKKSPSAFFLHQHPASEILSSKSTGVEGGQYHIYNLHVRFYNVWRNMVVSVSLANDHPALFLAWFSISNFSLSWCLFDTYPYQACFSHLTISHRVTLHASFPVTPSWRASCCLCHPGAKKTCETLKLKSAIVL